MNAIADQAFKSKLEVLLGMRKGAEKDRAVRLREIESILRNTSALTGIDPSVIKPIVDKAVDDALDGYTPPSLDPIIGRIDQLEQDAEVDRQAVLNAVAQAEAANTYTDEQVALVNADIAELTQITDGIGAALQGNLDASKAYTDTGFAAYNETIQGQFSSFAGQIQQLTAALTSANLVQNGLFALGDATWTLAAATVLDRSAQTGLAAACPHPNLVELAAASAASIATELNAFTVTADDRVQFRFFAAATAVRTITVTLAWFNAAGNPVGTSSTETLTITPANTWKAYGKQVDPPDTAVGATLTISKATGGAAALITAVEVSTVNVALEARVTQIEATQITEEDVIATIGAQVNSRFGDVESAISDEASTRASETAALASRQTKLSAALDREAGGIINDPYLASAGWGRWTGQGTLVFRDNEQFETGRTWDFTVTAAQQDGMLISQSPDSIWEGQKNASAYVVEVDYTLVSGTLTGTAILLDWNTTTTEFRAQKSLQDITPGTVAIGQVRTARAVFKRPSNFAGTFTSHDLFIMANFGALAAKRIKFHRVKVRLATDEELGSGEVMNAVKAELTANYYTRAQTNEAIAGFDFEAGAQYGTAWATVQQSATALAGLNGSVARFRNVVTVNGEQVAAGIEMTAWNQAGATGSLVKLIGDNVVAAGTLSTNKLVVGLGKNLLMDPSFDHGMVNYVFSTLHGSNAGIRPSGQDWAHKGWPTLYINQPNAVPTGYSDIATAPMISGSGERTWGTPIQGGKIYTASAYFSTHRCPAQIILQFIDAAGLAVSAPQSALLDWGTGLPANPDGWARVRVSGQAPATAVFARIYFRKYGTSSGYADSWLFIWKPQLEESAFVGQEPSPWSPGGTSVMDGGRLFSQSVYARTINTEDFAVAGLAIFNGTLKSDNFNEANFTGWRITKAGVMNMPRAVIKSVHIDDAQIKSAHIEDLAVDRIHVKGGAITIFERSFTASGLSTGTSTVHQSLTYIIGRPGPQIITLSFSTATAAKAASIRVDRVFGAGAADYEVLYFGEILAENAEGEARFSHQIIDPFDRSGTITYRMIVGRFYTDKLATNPIGGSAANRFLGVFNAFK